MADGGEGRSGLEASEGAHKTGRARQLNVVQYSLLRLFGFSALVLISACHLRFLQAQPDWSLWRWLALLSAAHCLASWLLLASFYERCRRFDLQLVPLNVDNLLYAFAVYATGAEASWAFPLLVSHVADQTNTRFQRVIWFAHMGPALYLLVLAWRAGVDGAVLNWPGELTKTAILYAFGVYWSLTALTAEDLRRRTREAVRVSRDLIAQLRAQTEELEEARVRAEASSQAKSAFLAAMTHELRTPLHAILGFSQLLRDPHEKVSAEESEPFLQHIHSSGTHLLSLINDVLDLVKVEQGRLEPVREEVHLRALLDEIRHTFEPQARERKLRFHVSGPAARVWTDPRRVRQILFNLLGNALDFTPAGGLVELQAFAADGRFRLEVRDNGVGIAPELHEKVFEEFYQAGRTPGRAQKGTGLGLALTRRLVRMLGGSIRLESAPGVGTTLTVDLPAGAAPPLSPPAPDPPPEEPGAATGATILIVEDNPVNMELMETLLQREGYRVLRAEDGRQGLLEARRHRPDLILMDLQLPDLDGLTVTRMLKGDSATRSIPIVAVTARGMREDEQQAREAGCDAWLAKPIDRAELLRCLRERLRAAPGEDRPLS